MSFSPSNIIRKELINVISSYITCYDCNNASTRVVDKSCSHLVCEKCSEAHSCNNSEPSQNCTLPPSLTFMNDLYDQLQKISSITSKSSAAIIPKKETRMGRKSHKRRHQSKMTNGHDGENKSTPDKKTINIFADPEALVTRYLSNGVEPNQAFNEMPVLEREVNQSQDYLDETQRPDKFDNTVNGTVNSTFDLTEDNINEVPSIPKKIKHHSTKNYIQRAENNSVSSLSSDDNCSVQESTSSCRDLISTQSLPGPSKIRRIQEEHYGSNFFDKNADEPKLIGFYEHEHDVSLIKLLRFKLVSSLSTSASIQSDNYEFTIRKVEIPAPAQVKHENIDERSDDIYNQTTPEASPERVHNLRDSFLSDVDDENSLTLNGERDIKPLLSYDKPAEEIRQSIHCSSGEEDPMENSLPIREAGTHLSTTRESEKETKTLSIRKKKKISKTKQKATGITPLNKIILREENEELKKKEISKKREKKEDNVWLSTSGLSSQEQMHVIKLARLTKAKLSNCFSHETTHFIVGNITEDNQDYLLAIAYGVSIVTIDWVTSCLAEGKIIDPTKFIHQADEGPAKCLDGSDKPFKGFYFFMGISPHPSHLDYATYQVTKTLCYHGGADIILDHDKFLPYSKFQKFHPRFFISISSDLSDEVKEMCVKLQAIPIKHTWIFSCMRQYSPLPIFDFMYFPLTIYDDINLNPVPVEILGSS